jgi:DNA-binding LacI/PurR family transcriptional regulator
MTDQQHAPLAPARHAHILAALERDGIVRVSRLTEELGVAPVTLRRDLQQLEEEGLLERVHGGAVSASAPVSSEPSAARSGGAIGVLVPSLAYYWPGVVRGMEAEARKRGLRLVLRGASYELQDERPALERLAAADDVRGLIVAPNPDAAHAQDVVQWLSGSGIPSVFVERDAVVLPDRAPVENVTSDHALGAVLAARHLAGLGHRRIGLILSRESPTGRKILKGWATACEELELSPSEHFESLFPDRNGPGFAAAVNTAIDTALEAGVTGLLIHSDPEAMAFIDIALNRGLSVPEDLSVVAYDDEVAQLFTPALTAVSPPRAAVGAAAIDLLARRLADPSRPVHRVSLSPMLKARESTAPAP